MQPGQTFSPGDEPPKEENVQQNAPQPEQQLAEQDSPQEPEPTADAMPSGDAPVAPWQFTADDTAGPDTDAAPLPRPSAASVQWTASEYVANQKSTVWFLLAGLGIIAVAVAVYFITREIISTVVTGVVGIAFVAFGARKPQVLDYEVDNQGLRIGQKFYPYQLFKSFSVLQEDAVRSILLMPTKRFNLPIAIYYDPKDEQEIVEALGAALPHEQRQASPIDRFMGQIRF